MRFNVSVEQMETFAVQTLVTEHVLQVAFNMFMSFFQYFILQK